LTQFVQYTEERIAVQKEKALIRMTGFAKNVIDDINEEPGLPRNNRNHAIVFMLQTCTLQLAGDGVLPRIDQVDTLFQHFDAEPIDHIVLFNALQLLDMLASQNWSHGKNAQFDEQRQVVHKLLPLVPYAFTFLRSWTEKNCHRIALFVTQVFQTLKAVLNILNVLNSVSSGTLPPPTNTGNRGGRDGGYSASSIGAATTWGTLTFGHTVSTVSNDNSSTPQENGTYNFSWSDAATASGVPYSDEDLAADVVLWLKTLKYAKLGYFDPAAVRDVGLLNIFCPVDLYAPAEVVKSQYRRCTVQEHVTKELTVFLSLGSALTTDALQCAELVAHLLMINQAKAAERAQVVAAVNASASAMTGGVNQESLLTSTTTGAPRAAARRMSALGGGIAQIPTTGADAPLIGGAQPSILPSIPVFGTPAHAVILAALELGQLSIARYAARMGPQGCLAGIAFSHTRFLKAADYEVSAALHCAKQAFSVGLLESSAYAILQHGYDLTVHRWSSYFFTMAWMQCALAATLLCIEKEIIPEDVYARGVQELSNKLRRQEASSTLATPVGASKSSTRVPMPLAPQLSSLPQTAQFGGGSPAASMKFSASIKGSVKMMKEPLNIIPKLVKAISTVQSTTMLYPFSTSFCKREDMIKYLSDAALRVMTLSAHLRHLVSVAHLGVLLMRLLMRDMFMRRMRIEELLEIPLLTLLIPVLDLKTAMELEMGKDKDSDDERETEKLGEPSIQDLTVRTPETGFTPETSLFENSAMTPPGTAPASPLDAEGSYLSGTSFFSKGSGPGGGGGGGGSRGSSRSAVPLVPQYWSEWTQNNLEKEFTNGDGYPTQRMTFTGFLQYVGETHLQSKDAMEQLLLLLDHLINKSQVCKFNLVDNGLPLVVQRILSSQIDNVYMIALSEYCSEQLELKI
jgi:uncharacterized membrane protein YgcG